ncbi:MAG: DUF6398 domain-containing protein [Oscillospiraceae bacterium]|nr:DUF6398 domain-containing protein [Oscillospiraceae bacterium]
MAVTTLGNCYICGVELGKTAMKNHILKSHGNDTDGEDCCLFMIEGAYDKDYWLIIDVPMDKSLSSVDKFLRKIWLECCGHLSAFRSQNRSEYREISIGSKLYNFTKGDKIIHEYDFGTTTNSLVTIIGSTIRKPQKMNVRLLARNVPLEFECAKCGVPAQYFCTECVYDNRNPLYCGKCIEKHEHDDMFLPVTNSPRMGECGYDGELDVFAFKPDRIEEKQQDLNNKKKKIKKTKEQNEDKPEKSSVKVPNSMLEKYEIISLIIKEFCEQHLNEEYSEVSLLMLEKLCRKRPSPIDFGKPNTWACGIIYAIGSINFLFDKSQTPHMRASELAEKFGISSSTAGNKAGEIRKLLKTGVLDPMWTLPSKLEDNPYVWMFETSDGFIIDVRSAPREIQEKLYKAQMIPFIPTDKITRDDKKNESKAEQQNTESTKKKRDHVAVEGQISFDEY